MSSDLDQNLRVLTEHIDEVAARHVTAAGVLKVAGETVNDISDRVARTHGVACLASNMAVTAVETARDDARQKLWQMSHDLGERLAIASANYNDADWRASTDIESCDL